MHRELRFLKNNIYFASMIFENRGLRKSALAGDCRGSRGEEVKRWPYNCWHIQSAGDTSQSKTQT